MTSLQKFAKRHTCAGELRSSPNMVSFVTSHQMSVAVHDAHNFLGERAYCRGWSCKLISCPPSLRLLLPKQIRDLAKDLCNWISIILPYPPKNMSFITDNRVHCVILPDVSLPAKAHYSRPLFPEKTKVTCFQSFGLLNCWVFISLLWNAFCPLFVILVERRGPTGKNAATTSSR